MGKAQSYPASAGFSSTMFIMNNKGMSQELTSDLVDIQPKYILINDVSFSELTFFEEENDSRAGYRYRLITTTSEIYNSLFLEKIIIDIEESPVQLQFSKKIKFDEIYKHYGLSEETNPVVFEQWLTANCFVVSLGKVSLAYKIIDEGESVNLEITKF